MLSIRIRLHGEPSVASRSQIELVGSINSAGIIPESLPVAVIRVVN